MKTRFLLLVLPIMMSASGCFIPGLMAGAAATADLHRDVELESLSTNADGTEIVVVPGYDLQAKVPSSVTGTWYGDAPEDVILTEEGWDGVPLRITRFDLEGAKDMAATIEAFQIQDQSFRLLESEASPGANEFEFVFLQVNSRGSQDVSLYSQSRILGGLYTCRSVAVASELNTARVRAWRETCRTLAERDPKVAKNPEAL